jgi:hypothetical protein
MPMHIHRNGTSLTPHWIHEIWRLCYASSPIESESLRRGSVIAGSAQGNKPLMLPGLRSMLAAMVATAILVTLIGIALIPTPRDSYDHSARFPQVGQPVLPQELQQNLKRQAYARRAAELTKLLRLAKSPVSITAESSSAASDNSDGRTAPQARHPETQRVDAADGGTSVSAAPLASQQLPACADVQRSVTSLEAKGADARPQTRATEVAEVGPAIEPTTVTPQAKPAGARLHARRRIRLTRGAASGSDAPHATAQANPDPATTFNGTLRTMSTSASPVAPPAGAGSRGSAF